VFENRILRRIFGPKRDEVAGEWRKLHDEELYRLYSSPDIISQVKSRQMRWAVMFRAVFWVILPCKMTEDSSEHHTHRRENLKSHRDGQ
jgi:hypothetical protein